MEWNLTGGRKLLIGMIHCLPLPGTYGATATIDEVIARAVSDAKALERVGFDAVMIENEDLCLEPHMTKVQFSAISMVARAVRSAVKLPLGLCCSGLNYEEALSIAKVVGGDFIRTPIFVDTVMNYNGIMTPCSGKIIRYRREISAEHVKIFADVQVKHYYMVNPEVDIATSAKWAQHQGADAVIVTGCSTGTETASSDLEKVKTEEEAKRIAASPKRTLRKKCRSQIFSSSVPRCAETEAWQSPLMRRRHALYCARPAGRYKE